MPLFGGRSEYWAATRIDLEQEKTSLVPGRSDGASPSASLRLRAVIRRHAAFLALLAVAAIIRAACVEAKGYEYDLFMFRDWAVIIHDQGLPAVLHAPEQDYIGYHYILGLVAAAYALVAGSGWRDDYTFLHVLKIPGTIADLGVIVLLYVMAARFFRRLPERVPLRLTALTAKLPGFGREPALDLAVLAAALYALNPGIIYASSYWGQLDAFPTFFMLASLAAVLERRLALAWALLAIGFVLKPQAVILFPLLGVLTLRGWGVRGVIPAAASTALVMVAGYGYFVLAGEGATVLRIYHAIFTDETVKISTSAWNIWWPARALGNPHPQEPLFGLGSLHLSYSLLSQVLTGLAGLLSLAYAYRSRSPFHAFIAASFLAFSFFMLPMKIHERYLFPLFALLAVVAIQDRRAFLVYVALTLTFAANLFGVFQVFHGEFFKQRDVALICSVVNSVCYVLFAAALLRDLDLPRFVGWRRPLRTSRKESGALPAT